jgi:hypothetical protein
MKKILCAAILCTSICTAALAQTEGERRAAFQFTFVHPLGTNGIHAPEYTNGISLNLLWGVSKNETFFTFGGLANFIRHDARGVQIAGLYNRVDNEGQGFLLSGLANVVKNRYRGGQLSGLGNVAEDFSGIQAAGLMNVAGDVSGIQAAGLINLAGNVSGIRAAGLMNVAGDVSGVQAAGLMNVAGDVSGIHAAGLMNVAGNVSGIQAAALMNVAGKVDGVQAAALVNVAGKVDGIQLAGLINIAGESDYPIGIVNLIKNGEKGVALAYSETGSLVASFRSGGRVTYGIIGLGYGLNAGRKAFLSQGGLGAHINLAARFRLNNELTAETLLASKNKATFKAGYHLLAAYRIFPRLEVFAGPGINYMYSDEMDNTAIFPAHSLWKKHEASRWQQLFIGYRLGVQYVFN